MPAPGYTYLTLGEARIELAERLEDAGRPGQGPYVYWTDAELNDLIVEAVRTWQALTGTFKQRAVFTISPNGGVDGSAFYDLRNMPSGILSFLVTDRDIVNTVLACLLEPPLTPDWTGTGQYAWGQVVSTLQNRINRWLADTGANVTRQIQMIETGPSASRIFLPEAVLDVRRAAWRTPDTEAFAPPPPPVQTVSLLAFGAAGNGGDDTAVFQAALNRTAAMGQKLQVPVSPEPYNVQPLFVPSGANLLVDAGVIIQATPGYGQFDRMININDATNVRITATGSTFRMRKPEYTTGEYRHVIGISGSSGVTIQGVTARDSGGDGIYIAGSLQSTGQSYSENVIVDDSVFDNHKRNAMSIISAQSVFVRRSRFTNTNGTAPEDGIDLEPNTASDRLVNIHFDSCVSIGNHGDGLGITIIPLTEASQPVSITVNGHQSSNNGRAGYMADYETDGTVAGVSGSIWFQGCSSAMEGTYGAWAHFYVASGPSLVFQDLRALNSNQSRTTTNNAAVGVVRGGGGIGLMGNVYFLNPTISDATGSIDYYFTLNDFSNVGIASVQFLANPSQLTGALLATPAAWGWVDNDTATTVVIGPGTPPAGPPQGPAPPAPPSPHAPIDCSAWAGLPRPGGVYTTLWRDDEYAMQAFLNPGSLTPVDPPLVWGKFVMPPVGVQVYPPPLNPGQLETLVVTSGPQIGRTPAAVFNTPTVLNIPEDFVWGMIFGALSDLFSADGPARDPDRAVYAETRYQESAELYRMNPTLLQTRINGVPIWSGSVFEMDAFLASWQSQTGVPQFAGMCDRNLVAFGPVPNAAYSVTMDVVANIPVPVADGDFLQVDRSVLNPLIDYAFHLASFKMAGPEFHNTDKLRQNFYLAAALENSRLTKANFYRSALQLPAMRQQAEVPRI